MSITEKFRFKHLQPSQFEGWLRRAEKANEGDDDYHDWDHMPKDYRACCNFALEMKDALDELLALRASHEELTKSLQAASHALRSFQYGNCAEEFAKESADCCDAALANAQKVREG